MTEPGRRSPLDDWDPLTGLKPRERLPGEPLAPDNINRSQIARELGVSLSHISRVFNAQRRPSLVMLRRIARALDVSTEELIAYLETLEPGWLDE